VSAFKTVTSSGIPSRTSSFGAFSSGAYPSALCGLIWLSKYYQKVTYTEIKNIYYIEIFYKKGEIDFNILKLGKILN
jgi:hypothetical protein